MSKIRCKGICNTNPNFKPFTGCDYKRGYRFCQNCHRSIKKIACINGTYCICCMLKTRFRVIQWNKSKSGY